MRIDRVQICYDNQFFQMVLEEASNIVFVKDEEFRIIYANKAFLQLYAPEDRDRIIGTTGLEAFPPEEVEGFLVEDRQALAGQRTQVIEEVTDYEGKLHTLLTRKIGFKDQNGKPLLLGICSEISEIVEKEKRLVEMNQSLEHFAALAAHDLRSPLNQFVSCIDLMRIDKENSFSEESAVYMDMMHSSAHNLAHQISTLLQMYKGADPNKWSMTDLNMLMTEVRFNLSHQIEATHAKVLNDMLPEIRVNKHLFRQLLHNLIENSIKYRKGKAPLIFIKAKEVEGGYEFHIEDNGIGVKDGKIFEIFSQQNTSSSGVGIGLALCRQIVERHDGKIWVDETYEDGTSICFFIPEKQMHNV